MTRKYGIDFYDKRYISTTNFVDNLFSWNFISQGISISVISTNSLDVVQYSFDRETLHGDLIPGFINHVVFDYRPRSKIWVRLENPRPSPVLVRIETWRDE